MHQLTCKFCSKVCKKPGSLAVHEKACKSNPNRIPHPNHWTKYPDYVLSDQARENFRKASSKKRHTQETKDKISRIRKKYLEENPDKVPYVLNHYSKGDSFPEKYFEELFVAEKFNLIKKHRIYLYELDFCDPEQKVDIEIDGEQHYVDSRIVESDKRRTEYLESLGWKVYRIRWSEYQKKTFEEKHKVVQHLKSLLRP
jgi:very-short-patch-repair endonuclease